MTLNFLKSLSPLFKSKKPRSCLDLRASRFFCIKDNDGVLYKVYCDLNSEPGWAWKLVMSQIMPNRAEPFTQSSVSLNHPINARTPNWEAYRLPLARMEELRSQSTHWQRTFSFPSSGVDYRDYVRAEFANFDLLTFQGRAACKEVDYINVRGHDCEHCTSTWSQNENNNGKFLVQISSGESCELGASPNFVGPPEHNFGRYQQYLNPDHRCTSDDSAATNYWFGGRI